MTNISNDATNPPYRVAVAGASGRMGRMLISAVLESPDCRLVAALDQASSQHLGRDAGWFLGQETGVKVSSDLETELKGADFLIDFTRPEGTLEHLRICEQLGVKMVIGTTGFDEAGKSAISAAAQKIGIVFAPNMSIGVNVTLKLLEMAARVLPGYDVEIFEVHHKHKVDAPSGTALKMGEVIAKAQGTTLESRALYERSGYTGERVPGTIGFATMRAADVVGEHTAMFASTGERIEIAHKSSSRAGYAHGSIEALRFLAKQPRSGLFDMFDVLGL